MREHFSMAMESCSQDGVCQRQNIGIETELTKTEKLSVAPVYLLRAMSACGEKGLTTIVC